MILDKNKPTTNMFIFEMISSWAEQAEKYRTGEINKDQYDEWRYNYPKFDETQTWAKVPSLDLNDAMVEQFKGSLKDM